MNIYKVIRKDADYCRADEYTSFICSAENEYQARHTSPVGDVKDAKTGLFLAKNYTFLEAENNWYWVKIEELIDLTVTKIGVCDFDGLRYIFSTM